MPLLVAAPGGGGKRLGAADSTAYQSSDAVSGMGLTMQSRWMLAAAFGALMTAASPALALNEAVQTTAAPATEAPVARTGLGVKELAMMERVSDPRVSPDGRRSLYSVRTTDWDGNKGVNALWLIEADGATPPRKLAISEGGVAGARWASDGQAIYFMSSRGGSNQVWRADREGMAAAQVTTLPIDVSSFRIAEDGRSLILAVSVFTDCATL